MSEHVIVTSHTHFMSNEICHVCRFIWYVCAISGINCHHVCCVSNFKTAGK